MAIYKEPGKATIIQVGKISQHCDGSWMLSDWVMDGECQGLAATQFDENEKLATVAGYTPEELQAIAGAK